MTRCQYIIIASVALAVIIIAVWLGIKFFSSPTITPASNLNNDQAVSLEKTSYKDRVTLITDLLATKLGKTSDNLNVQIAREDNTHIKGIVAIKGEGDRIFLAARVNGEWAIVWSEKDKYSCASVQSYNFPGAMVSDCLK